MQLFTISTVPVGEKYNTKIQCCGRRPMESLSTIQFESKVFLSDIAILARTSINSKTRQFLIFNNRDHTQEIMSDLLEVLNK